MVGNDGHPDEVLNQESGTTSWKASNHDWVLKASVGKRGGSRLPLREEARARNAQDGRGCWMWYHMPVMPAVGKWREDGQGFKVILNYTVSSGLA